MVWYAAQCAGDDAARGCGQRRAGNGPLGSSANSPHNRSGTAMASTAAAAADAFLHAAWNGRRGAVIALLADSRVDPADGDSEALVVAACRRHVGVVRALLADGRADPAARDSEALVRASCDGITDIVRALLADGRADPSARNNGALAHAARGGHIDVLGSLLADGSVEPAGIVVAADARNRVEVLRCIRRWEPWLRRRRWLRAAAGTGTGTGAKMSLILPCVSIRAVHNALPWPLSATLPPSVSLPCWTTKTAWQRLHCICAHPPPCRCWRA